MRRVRNAPSSGASVPVDRFGVHEMPTFMLWKKGTNFDTSPLKRHYKPNQKGRCTSHARACEIARIMAVRAP